MLTHGRRFAGLLLHNRCSQKSLEGDVLHCKGGLLHRTWRQQLSPSCDATAARTPAPRMSRFKASTLLCEVSVFLALESDPVPWLHQPGVAGEVSSECWRSCSQRHGVSHLKARLHLLTANESDTQLIQPGLAQDENVWPITLEVSDATLHGAFARFSPATNNIAPQNVLERSVAAFVAKRKFIVGIMSC